MCHRVAGRLGLWIISAFLSGAAPPLYPSDGDRYAAARAALVAEIESGVRETADHLSRDQLDEAVLEALREVPRHAFVPLPQRPFAYENRPLPIGHGQTISQPYIVAVMTDLLDPQPGDRVLELGTGSGYQAAVLARLVGSVYSIEIVGPLAEAARERLAKLGYANVSVRQGDGYFGWPEHAPFDAIVVTAAASHVPPPLVAQLKRGGRMIIPVGSYFLTQQLVLVIKQDDGSIVTRPLLPVAFVPLTGNH